MSFGIPFKCETVNGSNDLCFEGGVCTPDKQSCTCPPGWTHSTVGGHYPNCTQPSMFLQIHFAIHAFFTVVFVTFVYSKTEKIKSKLLQYIGKLACLLAMTDTLQLFAILVQGGRFEFALVVTFFSCLIGSELLLHNYLLFLEASERLLSFGEKERNIRNSRKIQCVVMIFLFILIILKIIYARQDQEFNILYYMFCYLFNLEILLLSFPTYKLINQAIKRIGDLSMDDSERVRTSMETLMRNRNRMRSLIFTSFLFSLPYFIVFPMYGSYPFEFIPHLLVFSRNIEVSETLKLLDGGGTRKNRS